ncbi:hypothetical protein RD1_2781 [Roseobacter denitrificans OCh 114]|uniref:Uncharacterized protein n=1 Tax=Roseobacter denitrificans (strain ATCC 33942 / OCh 114) TaxID=375451 RepID=Q165N1_ROSDO|nr:hypothetical protein RD1_2781 [Roseobacter denitrificans OCh 114]
MHLNARPDIPRGRFLCAGFGWTGIMAISTLPA